jgi:hypothetical protein
MPPAKPRGRLGCLFLLAAVVCFALTRILHVNHITKRNVAVVPTPRDAAVWLSEIADSRSGIEIAAERRDVETLVS